MRAIAVVPGQAGAKLVERPEPSITKDDQVKLQVLRVGLCGTDREQAAGGRALLPEGKADLVAGHEMFGRVADAGDKVPRVKKGDFALFTVRRGCGQCEPCNLERPDMCLTGKYRERGIWGLDGYQTEYVVDSDTWLVRVPETVAKPGVLAEPMSVVEKAITEAVRVQLQRIPGATLNWLSGRRCLVAGLGPVGLLGALVLRLRGADVYGYDVVPSGSARPKWFSRIGCRYLDGRDIKPGAIEKEAGPMDFILEAAGVASLMFNLLGALAPSGIASVTGIPHGDRCEELGTSELAREIVLDNRIMLGSVNAARDHFQQAIDDLGLAELRWPGLAAELITHAHSIEDAPAALGSKPQDEIKAVVEWAKM